MGQLRCQKNQTLKIMSSHVLFRVQHVKPSRRRRLWKKLGVVFSIIFPSLPTMVTEAKQRFKSPPAIECVNFGSPVPKSSSQPGRHCLQWQRGKFLWRHVCVAELQLFPQGLTAVATGWLAGKIYQQTMRRRTVTMEYG